MQRKYILLVAGFLVALNVFCWKEVFDLSAPRYLLVDFLDVGQGDAVFIETPQGHQILIDGGPNSSVLAKLAELMPFWDKTIDLVILTHPEKDHMTGILDVLQKYKVSYFLWTGVIKNDAENKKLASILDEIQTPKSNFLLAALNQSSATKVLIASAGEEIKAGDVLVDILFPVENLEGQDLKNSANDTSIINKIVYGENSFLFTGDIGSGTEKELVSSGKDIVSDVLKVAHHGSKYSTSDLFLQTVSPKYAVIEVGKNSYGHPTPEVLQRLEKFGIKVLRTDRDGDIKFICDGFSLFQNKK